MAVFPDAVPSIQANRNFLGTVVRFCSNLGISQFLDLGSGVPTVGNVHEIAHALNPQAKVAYVDNEPVAAAHAQRMLDDHPHVTVTDADLREPETVLTAPGVAGLFDFTQPTCILMVSVLNFVAEDSCARALLRRYTAALTPGSYLALTHVTPESVPADQVEQIGALYRNANPPGYWRTRHQIADLVDGFTLVEPGLVTPSRWAANPATVSDDERVAYLAAVLAT